MYGVESNEGDGLIPSCNCISVPFSLGVCRSSIRVDDPTFVYTISTMSNADSVSLAKFRTIDDRCVYVSANTCLSVRASVRSFVRYPSMYICVRARRALLFLNRQ